MDAACLGILKIGELINSVELMQHGFWTDFSSAHFLDMGRMRNLIGHTEELEGEDIIPLGSGIVSGIHTAIRRTFFPEKAGTGKGGFMLPIRAVRKLKPMRAGDKPAPDNSIAMIYVDVNHRFVINRVGRTKENWALISSNAP